MERYIWTADQDEVIRGMILEGKTVADICDRMGCTDTQLKNHVAVVRRRDPSFPTLCGEVKGERFVLASAEAAAVMSGEPGQNVPGSADEGTVELIEEPSETEEKKADLNPPEKQMADIITEQKMTIDNLRVELETEQESRELEAEAYRNEIKRLQDLVNAIRGTVSAQGDELAAKDKLIKKLYEDLDEARGGRDEEVDELRERVADLTGILARKREQDEAEARERDDAARLKYMVRERNEVIYRIVKTIFVGPKEGSVE